MKTLIKNNRERAHIFTCSDESTMRVVLETLTRIMNSTECQFELTQPFKGESFSIWADNILTVDVLYYQGIARGIYEIAK